VEIKSYIHIIKIKYSLPAKLRKYYIYFWALPYGPFFSFHLPSGAVFVLNMINKIRSFSLKQYYRKIYQTVLIPLLIF